MASTSWLRPWTSKRLCLSTCPGTLFLPVLNFLSPVWTQTLLLGSSFRDAGGGGEGVRGGWLSARRRISVVMVWPGQPPPALSLQGGHAFEFCPSTLACPHTRGRFPHQSDCRPSAVGGPLGSASLCTLGAVLPPSSAPPMWEGWVPAEVGRSATADLCSGGCWNQQPHIPFARECGDHIVI